MFIPRYSTLAEELYQSIEDNEYLRKIYSNLLYNYSLQIFNRSESRKAINLKDALRFSDILSKSINLPNSDKHRILGQELVILLKILYPDETIVNQYLFSVLSSVGNYRGLQTSSMEDYKSVDVLDGLFHEYEKEMLRIPGTENAYFFHDQKSVYDSLKYKYFSYSGPTSMGKSFVVQTYIKQQVESGIKQNYAILVPTKALINEVRSNLLDSFREHLVEHDYRIISSAGDILLNGKHNFIFIMTPERLLHLLIDKPDVTVDFLFIDEAHKISERGGRSVYYYKVVAQLVKTNQNPSIIFASPNVPNPEVYLKLIPDIKNADIRKLSSNFTPVCQFKFYIDFESLTVSFYNSQSKLLEKAFTLPTETGFEQIISLIGDKKQNLVYCHSRQNVVDLAFKYANTLPVLNNPILETLAKDIENDVHADCFLVDFIRRGVAYHVGYLPSSIRLRIEKNFADGIIRTIFCTSTLVEGVNLPADNLFITSYKNGRSNMDEVEFKNLSGRVGRIRYNLYGNVFLVRINRKDKPQRYSDLLIKDVPPQNLSLDLKENQKLIEFTIRGLVQGDIELSECHAAAKSEKDFEAMRKFSLVLTRDLATGIKSPVSESFSSFINSDAATAIGQNFPKNKTFDDITLSYDQYDNLSQAIASGMEYPRFGSDQKINFDEVVKFLMELRRIFKWEIYESQTIGKPGRNHISDVLRWYATILLRWINGHGLKAILLASFNYKEKHPDSGVWIGNYQVSPYYNAASKSDKNYVIADTLGIIENVILFSLSNYFRKFSLEYKAFHGCSHFDNDWYEFVEYGTRNPITIFLQQCGLSRDVSTFLQKSNSYLITDGKTICIKKSAAKCSRADVAMEISELMFNMPELFVD